jgi:hypothetical protein
VGGNGARLYGNELKNTGYTNLATKTCNPINNNHAIYIQLGASDVDVAWNYLHDLCMGHTIQMHTDKAFKYENVRIHDNVMTAYNPAHSRAINMGNSLPGTYGAIYNNTLSNLGQNFSAIVMGTGTWDVYNNTLYNIVMGAGGNGMITVWGHADASYRAASIARIRNNILYSDGKSAYILASGDAVLSKQALIENNLYYNSGNGPAQDAKAVNADPKFVNAAAGDFHLQAGSGAIGTGSVAVVASLLTDIDGLIRQTAKVDIGAYTYVAK